MTMTFRCRRRPEHWRVNLRARAEQRELINQAGRLLGEKRLDFMLEAACDKAHEGVETQVRQDMFHRCQHRETGRQGMAVRSRPGQALDGDCSADTVDTVLDHHRLPQQRGERCR